IVPFINREWWDKYYPHISALFGLSMILYYAVALRNGERMVEAGYEYISFVTLIGSLFVAAGGIHIRLKGKSTPLTNLLFLSIGAVISNIVGTTGASMI